MSRAPPSPALGAMDGGGSPSMKGSMPALSLRDAPEEEGRVLDDEQARADTLALVRARLERRRSFANPDELFGVPSPGSSPSRGIFMLGEASATHRGSPLPGGGEGGGGPGFPTLPPAAAAASSTGSLPALHTGGGAAPPSTNASPARSGSGGGGLTPLLVPAAAPSGAAAGGTPPAATAASPGTGAPTLTGALGISPSASSLATASAAGWVYVPTRSRGLMLEEVDVASPEAFQRLVITGPMKLQPEQQRACQHLLRAIELRDKYLYKKPAYYWGAYRPEDFPHCPGPHTRAASNQTYTRTAGVPTLSTVVSPGTPSPSEGLFYRRRPEPPFRPFSSGVVGPDSGRVCKMWKGVMQVYDAEVYAAGLASQGGGSVDDSLDAPAPSAAAPGQGGASGFHPESSSLFPYPGFEEYFKDYQELCRIIHTPYLKSFAFRRLELLEARFQLHVKLNLDREMEESKAVPHRDFYNVRKVDTHVHHSACMNQKHLLRFIKHKLKKCPDEVVIYRDGKHLTLAQVFESLSLTAYDLSVDTLDMHADWSTFHRFDRFNLKYNPVGQSRLREIFLKTDNYINGRYLAEITREVFDDLEATKYALAEYRISVYGRSKDEWSKLAAWVVDHRLASPTVRWMVQIPRLYETYRETGSIANFQQMLDNIFEPLFEVTRDPSVDPKLHQFLALLVGFDSVDDESKQEVYRDATDVPLPADWSFPHQPPYHYWNYFLAANIAVLNSYRASRGLTEFSFRPHSGEAGDVDHLAATYLTAESVNHGINLKKNPSLQYLYYLSQVGLAVSPLSNNRLFLEYNKNPFFELFQKGLNVSLSTDDPLMLAYTKEPLLEEYCVAAQVWKLNNVDMCEVARNSVLQSGFEYPYKAHFIGPTYAEPGPAGNDIHMTNVPYIRLQYRAEVLNAERELVASQGAAGGNGGVDPPAPRKHYVVQPPAAAGGSGAVAGSPPLGALPGGSGGGAHHHHHHSHHHHHHHHASNGGGAGGDLPPAMAAQLHVAAIATGGGGGPRGPDVLGLQAGAGCGCVREVAAEHAAATSKH